MQRKLLIGGLTAMALVVTGGFAAAQQRPARQAEISRADFVDRQVQRLSAADANGDGQISAQERTAGRQAKRAERMSDAFDRLDANRDGVLSREEFQARPMRAGRGGAARPGQAERTARRIERPAVSVADAQARAEQAFDRLDADRNGVLTAQERRAGRQQMRETRRERVMQRQASPGAAASE